MSQLFTQSSIHPFFRLPSTSSTPATSHLIASLYPRHIITSSHHQYQAIILNGSRRIQLKLLPNYNNTPPSQEAPDSITNIPPTSSQWVEEVTTKHERTLTQPPPSKPPRKPPSSHIPEPSQCLHPSHQNSTHGPGPHREPGASNVSSAGEHPCQHQHRYQHQPQHQHSTMLSLPNTSLGFDAVFV